jgi:anti-sigma B factor antagonist
MIFSVNTRKVGGAVIIDISGRFTMGEPALLLRETIRRFIAGGNMRFVINMEEVSYIDSSGLGELVATYTMVKNQKAHLKLMKLTPRTKDLLQMTKLLAVFDTYDDEQKAVAALASAAAHA